MYDSNYDAMNNFFLKNELKLQGMKLKTANTEGNHSYWKKFHVKSDKKPKIFFCTPLSKFQKISTLNICDGACI